MHELLPNIPGQLSQILGDILYFIPEIYLSGLFLVVLLTDILVGKLSVRYCRAIALAGMVLVLFKDYEQLALFPDGTELYPLFGGMLLLHIKTLSFKIIIDILVLILLVYLPWDNKLARHPKGLSDLYTIIIGSVLGLHLMILAVNMLSVYLAVEFVSIASYLMVAYRTENGLSTEAGLKYVLFGAASSAVLLYGISLLYGFTGTLYLYNSDFITQLSHAGNAVAILGIGLVLTGIGFKLSFVPVHFWVPDVYQGAPTPITAYLSTLPKIAGFAMLLNLITLVQHPAVDFRPLLAVIGIVTMIAGNFAAINQTNVKRMLAYSSIGHTGFALMGAVTFTHMGLTSLMYYLFVYALANITALLLASYFSNATGAQSVDGYKGLGFKFPVASVCFVVVLVSLTGLPVTAGFTGKLFIFSALYEVYQQTHDVLLLWMMITGAVTTVVSLFYYIKIPLNLFLRKANGNGNGAQVPAGKLLFLSVLLSLVLVLLGIFPNWLYNLL